ncbi:branched-chain amino acid transport system II carrier protein [Bacillus aerolatus]|uniref:Branched-chain amino acid transport system carrier protein n=1 Tax=Bacillus aerolatus TaxID=2653354 RepID=A0A6I1FIR6_9BACI|nr:branched-chain amino acid transport system II carrier protein [Bacillus aerolatus]KAB7706248.1 branched-chain amino acid transport system II carrier protein [Bacillus aerolatus]
MNRKDIFFTGLMLFALFFGAGNLIFPPFLGMEAGTSFWPAIIGFVITGVSLPILSVVAISLAEGGITSIGNRVNPVFGLVFSVVVYLAIGPFFGIPRAASVSFEMGVAPFLADSSNNVFIFIFMVIFFIIVYLLSLNPSKLVDRIGQWLTPALLISIAALCIAAFIKFDSPLSTPTEKYASAPFTAGFIEGYLTMDTIAALAFGIVVMTAFANNGIQDRAVRVKATVAAGIIAGIGLAAVYISIAWIGAKMEITEDFANGGVLLTAASQMLFGEGGRVLLGTIVALACLTTCIGLTSACAQFFADRWPAISYEGFVRILTLISFIIANMGLTQIISISVPILITIYPFAIVLVLLAFIHPFVNDSKWIHIGAVLMTALFSLNDGLSAFGLTDTALHHAISWVPFFSSGLGWVLPAIAGGLLGFLFGSLRKKHLFK